MLPVCSAKIDLKREKVEDSIWSCRFWEIATNLSQSFFFPQCLLSLTWLSMHLIAYINQRYCLVRLNSTKRLLKKFCNSPLYELALGSLLDRYLRFHGLLNQSWQFFRVYKHTPNWYHLSIAADIWNHGE